MEIVRSGSAEPTSLELLASTISQTPNPNPSPRKRKRKDSSISPPPAPSSELVVVHEAPAPTSVVEDESKDKSNAERITEPERKDDDDDGEISADFPPMDADGVYRVSLSAKNPKCEICGRGHYSVVCAYLTEIPDGGKLLNDRDYMIICVCGRSIDANGCCTGYCVPWRSKCVVKKDDLEYAVKHAERFLEYKRIANKVHL